MEKAGRYVGAYNLAMLAQPDTPYADLCRPGGDSASHMGDSLAHPEAYSLWDHLPTERTRSLGEAARHGTLAEVRRWLAQSASPDAHDGFELTPLAWAVLRRRPDVAAVLLDAGADPLADPSGSYGLRNAPLRIAVLMKDASATDRLMEAARRRGAIRWSRTLLQAAASTGQADLLRRLLDHPHDSTIEASLAGPDTSNDVKRVVQAYQASLCWSAATPANARAHLVAIYEAGRPGPTNAPWSLSPPESGTVAVEIRPTDHPVLLVLSAYKRVDWRVRLHPGAALAGVLVFGQERPGIAELPSGVPLLVNDTDRACAGTIQGPFAYQPGADMDELLQKVRWMTNRPVANWQGAYAGTAYVVPGDSKATGH